MNTNHRYNIGQDVCFAASVHKKHGTVIAQEQSYGLPTYQVKIDNEIFTLNESDLSN